MKKTKIVCSIGPASNQADVMEQMVLAGMDIARINFTHATLEERRLAAESAREVRRRTGKNVAILWDTKGPEFRSGLLVNDSIELVDGAIVRIVKDNIMGTAERFTVNHPEALDGLEVGDIVLLENAKMKLEVISVESDGVTCRVLAGGTLGNRKSMSVPGKALKIPYVSDLDRQDIKYACEHGGEYLAISFVSTKENVLEVKEILKQYNREDLKIICKIENQVGIDNLREILSVSEGIMIGRGDLGTEIPSEEVPHAQKLMIQICREMGKVAITATEMLETMMENSRPKRAETSDIANAVLDGTDAVMLSGETTVGKHPIETVKAMADICEVAEKYTNFNYLDKKTSSSNIQHAIAESVVLSSDRLGAKVIVAETVSGSTAEVISNMKPKAPILAMVPSEKAGRYLALNWGVYPVAVPTIHSTDEAVNTAISCAKEKVGLVSGDKVIITGSFPRDNNDEINATNFMKIEEISE